MKAGDIVEVKNQTIGGRDLIEGEAKLIKPSSIGDSGLNEGWEYWLVDFTDQKGEYFDRVIKVS